MTALRFALGRLLQPVRAPRPPRPRCTVCGGAGYLQADHYVRRCSACSGSGMEPQAWT